MEPSTIHPINTLEFIYPLIHQSIYPSPQNSKSTMKITISLSLFHLLVFGDAGTTTSAAFTLPNPSSSTFSILKRLDRDDHPRSGALYALDPIVEAYKRRGPRDPFAEYASMSSSLPGSDNASASVSASAPSASEVVIDTVATPVVPVDIVPDVPEGSYNTDGLVDAINNAASAAMDASDRATEAAASFAAPLAAKVAATAAAVSTAATATVTTSESDSSPERVANLFELIKTNAKTIDPSALSSTSSTQKAPNLFDSLPKLPEVSLPEMSLSLPEIKPIQSPPITPPSLPEESQQGLVALGKNLMKVARLDFSGPKNIDFPSANIDMSGAAGAGASLSAGAAEVGDQTMNLMTNLQFDKYGAWYITAASLFFAFYQREEGEKAAAKVYQQKLLIAQVQANEASAAAEQAAEGAKLAKQLAAELPMIVEATVNVGEELLENSKIEQLRVENELLVQQILQLTIELKDQKERLDSMITSINGPPVKKEPKVVIPKVQTTLERDPEEDEKILSVLKEIDEENAKRTKAQAKSPKKKAKTTRKKAKASKKKVKASKKEAIVASDKADENLQAIEAAEDSFKEAITETAEEKKETIIEEIKTIDAKATKEKKKAPKVKKARTPKKKGAAKKVLASTDGAENVNPWGVLKESTLKRKTIAQLSAYLLERDVDVSGLSKTDLVGTIQSL